MYEWKTAQNAIYLDDEVAGKGRQFKCRFLVPGLVKYDFGVCLLTKENADKFIQGFVGCPVIINHQELNDKNAKEKSVGNIFSVWFDDKDGYYWCNGIITDKHAIELIDKGYSVSCQYTITDYSDNTTGALHNGNSYDKMIEDGKPEHLAIVNNPRYEGAIIAVNAILAQNEDKWITVHPNGEEAKGRHLLLKDGESVEDAMHRNGWYEKRQVKEDKKDTYYESDMEEKINKFAKQYSNIDTSSSDFLEKVQKYFSNEAESMGDGEYFNEIIKPIKRKIKVTKQEDKKEPDKEEKGEQTLDDKIKEHENKIPRAYKRNTKTKALWLYKNNYITRTEFEKVQTASNSFVSQFKDTLYTVLAEGIANRLGELIATNEDKWITIHPHGKESDDYRRLKIKEGETVEDAMHRQGYYNKRQAQDEKKAKENKIQISKEENTEINKQTEKIRDLVKTGFNKQQFYDELDKETDKLWKKYTKAVRETSFYFDDSEEVKKIKKDKLEAIHQEYAAKRDERSKLASEINEIIRETRRQQIDVLNKLKDKIDIKNSLQNYDSKEITQKIQKVVSEFDVDKLDGEYKEVAKKIDLEKEKWLKYINSASTTDEQNNRVKEYDDWYKNSELKGNFDKLYDKIINFTEYRQKAISEALQIPNSGDFNITTIKNSKLAKKVKQANELLTGIVNKDYLPNFSPHANGQAGRANATGNIINITSKHSVATYLHEAMHWLERVNPNMLANSMAFLEYRTSGETSENLKKLTGLKYNANEKAKTDKFFNPYCGKVYDNATEIMSMGIQRLFEAPGEFMKEDKEYFDFVIANLQGKI